MKSNKIIPIVLLVIMALAALAIKRCRSNSIPDKPTEKPVSTSGRATTTTRNTTSNTIPYSDKDIKLDRNASELFFTKHARCRMKCRDITQKEIKDILANGTVNYNKSNLQDPQGPTYALEGNTNDGQHVRIIFAPKQSHLTVVTVIDLDVEHECSCP